MDCQMPEMNGYEATAAIRPHEGADRHTPIIAMTAGARREDRERCLAEGMDSYLAKPVSKDALLALVARSITHAASAGPAAASKPVLDPQIIDRLERLGDATGEDLMGQLTELFLSDADLRVAELRDALAAGDAERCERSRPHPQRSRGEPRRDRPCRAVHDAGTRDHGVATAGPRDERASPARAGRALLAAIEAELERVRSALVSPALAS